MSEEIVLKLFMKSALILIMFSMGLSLKLSDFRRIIEKPLHISIGSLAQIILLPFLAIVVCLVAGVSSAIMIGVIIVSLCPGGPVSNYFSHLADANPALSTTLTTVSTLISLITLPFIFSFPVFVQYIGIAEVPYMFMLKSLLVGMIVPVAVGMIFRSKFESIAVFLTPLLGRLGLALIFVVLFLLIKQNFSHFDGMGAELLVTVPVINVLAMLMGFVIASGFKWDIKNRITLSFEVGLQNVPLATVITYGLLEQAGSNTNTLSIVFAVIGLYAISSILSALLGVLVFKKLYG